ncbi:SAM-dependent methyltransferase [Photobacterium halotolerans]|uniref:SAM-dependent methyltransferase n=1 Tax=Photobacterium halotolerans TaxID=265726 RepID=UPI0003F7915E|nr:class I SAM-dependent methyltransferase [Photobacterium halotolerans]
MLFNSPLSLEKAHRLIDLLSLHTDSHVIDIGCGEGEFLLRLASATGAHCLGLDISETCIAAANAKAEALGLADRVTFEVADANDYPFSTQYDVAICMGSTHAFGEGDAGYPAALTQMQQWLKPHGQLLIGEAYWKQPPAQAYLDFIGEPIGIYYDHQGNMLVAESHGLATVYAATSNQDEWDHFEGCFRLKAERAVMVNPEDDKARQKRDAVREWNAHYHQFGRDTMGFGFYLFIKDKG